MYFDWHEKSEKHPKSDKSGFEDQTAKTLFGSQNLRPVRFDFEKSENRHFHRIPHTLIIGISRCRLLANNWHTSIFKDTFNKAHQYYNCNRKAVCWPLHTAGNTSWRWQSESTRRWWWRRRRTGTQTSSRTDSPRLPGETHSKPCTDTNSHQIAWRDTQQTMH